MGARPRELRLPREVSASQGSACTPNPGGSAKRSSGGTRSQLLDYSG